jgi:hypothetical protein
MLNAAHVLKAPAAFSESLGTASTYYIIAKRASMEPSATIKAPAILIQATVFRRRASLATRALIAPAKLICRLPL